MAIILVQHFYRAENKVFHFLDVPSYSGFQVTKNKFELCLKEILWLFAAMISCEVAILQKIREGCEEIHQYSHTTEQCWTLLWPRASGTTFDKTTFCIDFELFFFFLLDYFAVIEAVYFYVGPMMNIYFKSFTLNLLQVSRVHRQECLICFCGIKCIMCFSMPHAQRSLGP